jgi:hypothetical protein
MHARGLHKRSVHRWHVLQQSMPWWPCDEQCIEWQHCIACSGVVAAPQSNAYAPRATARITRNNGLAKRITHQAKRRAGSSQACVTGGGSG